MAARIGRTILTLEDPFYLAVNSDGSVVVYVDGSGTLLVPVEELRRAAGKDRP